MAGRTSTVRRLSVAYLLSLGWSQVSHNGVVDLYSTANSGGLIVRLNGRDFACTAIYLGANVIVRGAFADSPNERAIMLDSLRQVYTRKA